MEADPENTNEEEEDLCCRVESNAKKEGENVGDNAFDEIWFFGEFRIDGGGGSGWGGWGGCCRL